MKLHKDPPPGYFDSMLPNSPTSTAPPTNSSYSARSRPNSNSTNITVPSERSSPADERLRSCSIDADDWFARLHGDLGVHEDLPTREQLASVGDIPLYDAEGNSRPFKSIYSGDGVIGERQLVVFVRHFYCGACQAYLKALTRSIDPQTYFTMSVPTSIVIIGCGSPDLIRHYKAVTGTVFPVFAEPTRKLFKGLGMGWTLDIGKRPDYMKDISPPAWLAGQIVQVSKVKGRNKFKGGNLLQVGGEFLFSDEEVIWCHRMKDYRNHTEMDVLRRVLEIDV